MISLKDAIRKVKTQTKTLKKIDVSISNALDFVLAKDIYSPISFPPFPQSAMDGYVIRKDFSEEVFKVVHEIKAGDNAVKVKLNTGEAIRIFTGAMIPEDAYCVVRQEDVFVFEGKIKILVMPSKGVNIRLLGEQIKKDSLAIKKGSILNPGAIGYLSMLGIDSVSVYSKPIIKIITTGNELTKIGDKLLPGKIYESNSNTLLAGLNKYGFDAKSITVEDTYEAVKDAFQKEIKESDLVIFTGGISVGDYDFVGKVLDDLGVNTVFYKVKQKPGKPLFFGEYKNKSVFGLPGNPAAVLTSFYLYVLPCMAKMIGRKSDFILKSRAKITSNFTKTPAMTHLLKGLNVGDKVELLPAQSSAMLSSFVSANCIAIFDEGKEEWSKGDMVEILMI
jgi:molybdopterin molybdotransferase